MESGLNTWLTQAQLRRTLDNDGLEKFRARIIARFDSISHKYEDTYCDSRSRASLMQDLYILHKSEVQPMLGDELGKKVFKEALIQYCGFAYGVALFGDLFSHS